MWVVLTSASDEDGDDHAVHTEHTSHDDGDDRSEEEVGLEDSHRHNTDAGLGSAVGSTEVGEDESAHNAHGAEENGLVGVAEV